MAMRACLHVRVFVCESEFVSPGIPEGAKQAGWPTHKSLAQLTSMARAICKRLSDLLTAVCEWLEFSTETRGRL